MKTYDGRFKDLFQEIYEKEFGLNLRVRVSFMSIDLLMIWSHALNGLEASFGPVKTMMEMFSQIQCPRLWVCGLMTSQLMTPDGKIVEAEALMELLQDMSTSKGRSRQQTLASIYAWTGGLSMSETMKTHSWLLLQKS